MTNARDRTKMALLAEYSVSNGDLRPLLCQAPVAAGVFRAAARATDPAWI